MNSDEGFWLEEGEIISQSKNFFNSSGILILSELCEGRGGSCSLLTSRAQQGAWHMVA